MREHWGHVLPFTTTQTGSWVLTGREDKASPWLLTLCCFFPFFSF